MMNRAQQAIIASEVEKILSAPLNAEEIHSNLLALAGTMDGGMEEAKKTLAT